MTSYLKEKLTKVHSFGRQ